MTTQVERNRKSIARKEARGLVRVQRWVHKSRLEEFDRLVRRMQSPKGKK